MWQAGYPVIEKAGYPVPYNMQYGLIGICQKLYFSGPTGKRKCFPEVPVDTLFKRNHAYYATSISDKISGYQKGRISGASLVPDPTPIVYGSARLIGT